MRRFILLIIIFFACTGISASDYRNTLSVEAQTRLDQQGKTSFLVEDSISARISERFILLGRGIYHLREPEATIGGGLGAVVVLGGGTYSEIMYSLLRYGEGEYTHRLYGDVSYETASSLTNLSTTGFISSDHWSMLFSASYRHFLHDGAFIQGRYLMGYAPSTEELLTYTGVVQASYPFRNFQFSLGGGAGTSAEEDFVQFGWTIFGSADWEISQNLRVTYGISYEQKEVSSLLANRIMLSTRW